MPFDPPSVELGAIAPELVLAITALFLMVLDSFYSRIYPAASRWYCPVVSSLGVLVATGVALSTWGENDLQLGGAVALDGFSIFVKVGLATFAALTIWLTRDYLEREGIHEAEFYVLLLFATAGMMLMASAADLIVVFLALETFSLALYVLVGFRRRSLSSQESALKYFLLGSFSSAFFLLGIALAYGAAGTTNYHSSGSGVSIAQFLASTPANEVTLMVVAAGLLIIGLAFKVAAVPFHMWTPDAYQGAPSPVTGFMAAATKLAAFAAVLRLLDAVLYPLRWDWRPMVIGVAIVTMFVGSIIAVVQEDLKRMLAYSSIAHAGFILTGVIAANDRGISGSLFYLATYGITVLGAFAVVAILSGRDEKRVRLTDYKGLFYENPLLCAALTLFLLSLAGVPITAGFVGKLVVFGAAVEAGYAWLAVAGVIASAIAAFFYLRVMVVMYMQESDQERPAEDTGPLGTGVVAFAAAATLIFGLLWGPLVQAAEEATFFAGL